MSYMEVDEIWMDGEFIDWKTARIHALSHVVHYGTGVFEGIRCYDTVDGPALFRLDEHLRRFEESASVLDMDMEYDRAELAAAIAELIDRNDLELAYVRPIAFYGYGSPGYSNYGECPTQVMIAAWPSKRYEYEPIRVQVSSWRRMHPAQIPTTTKASGTYLNSMLAHKEAAAGGYDDSILLNQEGNVAEGASANLFVVRDGTVHTPGLDAGILNGITRRTVMEIARDEGFDVEERTITTGELYRADELFLTGTNSEIKPIGELAGDSVGDGTEGPVTTSIRERFDEIVSGRNETYADWLVHV